jgi:Domain of unknown function (DUF4136)
MRVAPKFKILLAAIALGAVSACATPFRADVQRFQQMPAPQGQTFSVEARDENLSGGLEFQHYANLVAAEMARVGYRQAASGERGDFVVKLAFGVDEGRERVVSEPGFGYGDPFWGPGWGYRGFYGRPAIVRTRRGFRYVHGFYDPFLFGPRFGDYGNVRSYTIYTSGLDLLIERGGTGERLFEGSAEAVSRGNDLTVIVPNLVEAMFTGFPGNSGEKTRITIAPPERN